MCVLLFFQKDQINVGSQINCIKKNVFNKEACLVATGGKDNDLKIWNLSINDEGLLKNKEAVFRAKNVADNWMQLREPVWIMCIDFVDEKKVAVGTAHHQVSKCRNNIFDFYQLEKIKKKLDHQHFIDQSL